MKSIVIVSIVISFFHSCSKDTKAPLEKKNPYSNTPISDPRLGSLLKWKCVGGDTMFTDTLFMKLTGIKNTPQQQEEFTYTFNKPIWTHSTFVCLAQDINYINNITLTSPECKAAVFQKLSN